MCVAEAKLFMSPAVGKSDSTYNKSWANANEVIEMYPVSVGNLHLFVWGRF